MKARLVGGGNDGQVVEVDLTRPGFDYVRTPGDRGGLYHRRPGFQEYFRAEVFAVDGVEELHTSRLVDQGLAPVLPDGEVFERLRDHLEGNLDNRRILSLPVERKRYDPSRFAWLYRVSLLTEVIR